MQTLLLKLKVEWSNGHSEWLQTKTVKDFDPSVPQGDGISFYSIYEQGGKCDVDIVELTNHLENLKTKYSEKGKTQLLDFEIKPTTKR